MSKKKVSVGIIVAIILFLGVGLGVGLLKALWPPSFEESSLSELCNKCGLSRYSMTTGPIGNTDHSDTTTSVVATPLSDWFESRFGTNCSHKWQNQHIGYSAYASLCGIRWKTISEQGSYYKPMLVYLYPEDRATLEELARTDVEKCKEYITSQFIHESWAEPLNSADDEDRR